MLRPASTLFPAALALSLPIGAQSTTLVSKSALGTPADKSCSAPAFSDDGRFVAFHTSAGNLVMGDTNNRTDVYVRDLQLGTVERVSVASDGTQGDGHSTYAEISDDGRYVVFHSDATTLSPYDYDDDVDVYVHDRQTGTTTLISSGYASGIAVGGTNPSISGDGRWVAFDSSDWGVVPGDTNNKGDIFLRDTWVGLTFRVSVTSTGAQVTEGHSFRPSVSGDGSRVAFSSYDNGLVPGDPQYIDVFVHDLQAGWTRKASVDSNGNHVDDYSSSASISRDGRFVSFTSFATNLVPNDTNGFHDVFVHDLENSVTELVSVSSAGVQGNAISGLHFGIEAALSRDGRFVTFRSEATNLVAGDTNGFTDIFRRDRLSGLTERMSLPDSGGESDADSWWSTISGDGALVAFETEALNLVTPPPLIKRQIYLRDPGGCPAPSLHCTAKTNSQGCAPQISWTGTPSASGASPFSMSATSVINQQVGIFIYGKNGPAATPFQGGFLCMQAPVIRTGAALSGGNPPPADCSGVLTIDFRAWIASGADPGLVQDVAVDGQFWYRDPAASFGSGLSNAVSFVLCP